MEKYLVYFVGTIEVDANNVEEATKEAWRRLNMEDDIFSTVAIQEVEELKKDNPF